MKQDAFLNFKTKASVETALSTLLASRGHYALPGDTAKDVYLLPVSGGADSAALAILMHYMFPGVNFKMCMTDTKAEEPDIYVTIDRLEAFLGKPIERVEPPKGLYELIEQYGGYLPSPAARYCTRELKLVNFKTWLTQFQGVQKHMFVGIRSDESSRIAFTIDEVNTEMPFVDLELKREDIYYILDQTIGIPAFYRRRTRSGCSVCPFQRRSELVGLLQEKPIEFHRGMQYEKLAPSDAARHAEAMPLWKDSGIAANWLTLPMPEAGETITGKKPKLSTLDIFGMRGIFVGAEFFFDGWLGLDEFIFHQRVVSYSPTLAGIRRQLDDRYQHLLSTGEVYGMTPDEVREKARFAIYYVELPEYVFDPEGPKEKGYTWHQGESYKQLRHVIQWVTRALQAEGMRQEANKQAKPLTVQEEWIESSKAGLSKLTEEVGQISTSQWYKPSEQQAEMTAEEEVLTMPCPMCSI